MVSDLYVPPRPTDRKEDDNFVQRPLDEQLYLGMLIGNPNRWKRRRSGVDDLAGEIASLSGTAVADWNSRERSLRRTIL